MSIATGDPEERAELDAVLSSGIFNRAPNLARFLQYVCDQHFRGDRALIKEYSIATEALHRPPDFDQRKDSIVRVEAHQLRKRLADYYRCAGADHLVQIHIPPGQYAPQFTHRQTFPDECNTPLAAALEELPMPEVIERETAPTAETKPMPLVPSRPWHGGWQSKAKVAGLFVAMALVILLAVGQVRIVKPSAREVWSGPSSEPVSNDFRLLAGFSGAPFTDRQGRVWQPDSYFDGGVSLPMPADLPIEGLPDPAFPKTRREGAFSYAIPVRQGTYEVHLHFVSLRTHDIADTSSVMFQVRLNNALVLSAFDPVSDGGGCQRFHSRVIRDVTPAKDGKIHVRFEPLTGNSFVSAIEVLSSRPGSVRPVRIVAAKSSVVDSAGQLWSADEDYIGGFLVERRDSVISPSMKVLFSGEHYGNFAYHVPLPSGRYRVRLYFAETYFGSKLPQATPPLGARLFNVYANGLALLRDFDVAKEAGGANLPTVKEFENIEPNAQGNIILEFVPIRNYAEVNALEISQME